MRSNPLPTPTQPREVDPWLVAVAVGAACLLIFFWRIFDVPVGDGAKYCGYIALFIALPGMALLSLVRGRERLSGLEMVVVGVPLGLTLSVLGAVGSLALGLRWFAPYPSFLLGLLCALAVLVTRGLPRFAFRANPETRRVVLVLGVLIAFSVVLASLEMFPFYPLPEKLPAAGVTYADDMSWHIGNAASLKSFWPPADLRLVGAPLHYYIAYHFHAAMASVVTHVEPAVIVLRLSHTISVVQVALGLFYLGREVTKRSLGGFVALGLGLLLSDLSSLLGTTKTTFLNLFVRDLFLSPTYALGVVTMIAALVVLGRYFSEENAKHSQLAIVFLLIIGLGAAKTPAVPVVVAACAGVAGLSFLRTKTLPVRPSLALLITLVALGLVWPFVIFKTGAAYVRFAPLATIGQIPAYSQVLGGSAGGAITAPFRALFVLFGFAPLVWIGFVGFLKRRPAAPMETAPSKTTLSKQEVWLQFMAMVALAGGCAVLLLDGAGLGQIWFWLYGYVGFVVLAAFGLIELGERAKNRAASWQRYAIGLVAFAALGSTMLRALPGLRVAALHNPLPAGPLTSSRVEAFRWIRENTPAHATMAIDHHTQLYGSALAERQFLLENDEFMLSAYLYRFSSGKVGAPPNEALRGLVRRIFEQRDPAALQEVVERYGVDYLLDDKQQNPTMLPFDPSLAKLVFSNSTLDIYVVTAAKKER